MSVLSAIALEGMREAGRRVERVAGQLAQDPLRTIPGQTMDSVDLSGAFVELLAARNAHAVAAKLAVADNEQSQHLLDILA